MMIIRILYIVSKNGSPTLLALIRHPSKFYSKPLFDFFFKLSNLSQLATDIILGSLDYAEYKMRT